MGLCRGRDHYNWSAVYVSYATAKVVASLCYLVVYISILTAFSDLNPVPAVAFRGPRYRLLRAVMCGLKKKKYACDATGTRKRFTEEQQLRKNNRGQKAPTAILANCSGNTRHETQRRELIASCKEREKRKSRRDRDGKNRGGVFTPPRPTPVSLEKASPPREHARVWDEKRLVGEETHAAEGRVTALSSVALHVATHDAGAGDNPMDLQELCGAGSVRWGYSFMVCKPWPLDH